MERRLPIISFLTGWSSISQTNGFLQSTLKWFSLNSINRVSEMFKRHENDCILKTWASSGWSHNNQPISDRNWKNHKIWQDRPDLHPLIFTLESKVRIGSRHKIIKALAIGKYLLSLAAWVVPLISRLPLTKSRPTAIKTAVMPMLKAVTRIIPNPTRWNDTAARRSTNAERHGRSPLEIPSPMVEKSPGQCLQGVAGRVGSQLDLLENRFYGLDV